MKPGKLRPWKTLSKKVILDHGRFLKVETHEVQLPDGAVIPDWAWIIIPSAAIVLAVTADQEFLCFRQTKYAIEGTSLAPVGGMLEPDEKPLEAAKRELREEMGYTSTNWVDLGSHIVDPNRGVATMHLFLALDAEKESEPDSDDLEDQELIFLDQAQLQTALRAGEFKVLAWSAVVALSLNYLSSLEK